MLFKEWKCGYDYYVKYLLNCGIEEANKFMALGFFTTILGDTVLNALANVLSMQLIVFVAQDPYPVIHISPRQVKCGYPMYLAFTNSGCRH